MVSTMDSTAQNEPPVPPVDRATALAESLTATLRVAHALVDAHRDIDLAGFEQEAGRLAAAALDLPLAQGRALRPRLVAVLAEMDSLTAAIAAQQEDGA
jgi:hypothetical protein